MCVAGNPILYELGERYGIGYRRLGKLIVATNDEETGELQILLDRGQRNGVESLKLLSKREMKELEPNVEGVAAILSPSTGLSIPKLLCSQRGQKKRVEDLTSTLFQFGIH